MAADWSVLARTAARARDDFAIQTADAGKTQRWLLARILAANRDCEFGRRHDFASIRSFADYCARIPVCGYEGFAGPVARMAAGEAGVLASDPVVAFEETGGSSGGSKLVPYTAEGLAGFRHAVLPWLGDLMHRRPRVMSGRAYVTISPATRPARLTAGGLPIGLASDAAYLGADLAADLAAVLAVPPDLGATADPGEWQMRTLTSLVAARDLSFVSLWSPTFLLTLLSALEGRVEDVMTRLAPAERRRLNAAMASGRLDTQVLWPILDCISCWSDGASAAYARQLSAMFPHTRIEPKGLLATEAAVTVPWGGTGHCIPAVTSSLIEFHDSEGTQHLCDTLRDGEAYRVVVTTASGFYRYDLGDRVECTGHVGGVPSLRFIGRAGVTSDLVGEKLEEHFVARALSGLHVPAALVARADPAGYVLLLGAPCALAEARVEAALGENPQYAHARRMGQLSPLDVRVRADLSADMSRLGLARGRWMGDLKPTALVPAGVESADWLNL